MDSTVKPEFYDLPFYDHLSLTTTFSGMHALSFKYTCREWPPV